MDGAFCAQCTLSPLTTCVPRWSSKPVCLYFSLQVNKAARSPLSNSLWIVAVSRVLGLCLPVRRKKSPDQTRVEKTSAFRNNEAVGSILHPVGILDIDSIFSWAGLEEVVLPKTIE